MCIHFQVKLLIWYISISGKIETYQAYQFDNSSVTLSRGKSAESGGTCATNPV